jgi:hypothetical protein
VLDRDVEAERGELEENAISPFVLAGKVALARDANASKAAVAANATCMARRHVRWLLREVGAVAIAGSFLLVWLLGDGASRGMTLAMLRSVDVFCSGESWAAVRRSLDDWSELGEGTVTGAGCIALEARLHSACSHSVG